MTAETNANNNPTGSPSKTKRRRLLSFSLRTILGLMIISSICLGLEMRRYRAYERIQSLSKQIDTNANVLSYRPRIEIVERRKFGWLFRHAPKQLKYEIDGIDLNRSQDKNSSAAVTQVLAECAKQNGIQMARLDRIRWTPERINLIGKCTNLRSLVLSGNECTDDVMKVVMQLPYLEGLAIENTQVTEEALRTVTAQKHLRWLYVRKQHVGSDTLHHLRSAMPNTYVTYIEPTN